MTARPLSFRSTDTEGGLRRGLLEDQTSVEGL